jgi:cytochrome c
MNKPAYLATLLLTGALSLSALGIKEAAKDESLGIGDSGVALFMADGSDAGCPATSDQHGPFVDRDSHLAVHGLHRKCLAHGAEAGQTGRDPSYLTDVGGKCFVKEHGSLAEETRPGSCQGCESTNLANRNTQPKTMCGERLRESKA